METVDPFDPENQLGKFPYRFTHEDRHQYRLKVQPVAGQLEFSIRPVDTRLPAMAAQRAWMGFPKRIGPKKDSDREDNQRRAFWRARARIRLLCLEMRVDRMMTFTSRPFGGRILTYDEALRAWDIYRRMATAYDPMFRYVATPERQPVSGQWHFHVGVHGFHNIDIHRRMWQSALNRVMKRDQSLIHGADSPGTVNLPPYRGMNRGTERMKAGRIAHYVSKYISKTLETEFNRKSYFHSDDIKLTPAQAKWLEASTRDKAILEVLEEYGLIDDLGVPTVDIWMRSDVSCFFVIPDPMGGIPPPF